MGREILTLPAPPYDHRIAYGEDPNQFGYLRLPEAGGGPHAVAVVIHGGFWRSSFDLEHSGHMCAALTRAGVATWSLEYRRMGNAGGGWPGTCEDVLRGAEYARTLAGQFGLNAARMIAIGHSAGGHLALWLASQRKPRLRGAVALAGLADLGRAWELGLSNTVAGEFMGGSPGERAGEYAKASPIERVPLGTASRLIHGDADEVVPIEISERFVEAAAKAGDDTELIRLEGADHFAVIDPRTKEWATVERVVMEMLAR